MENFKRFFASLTVSACIYSLSQNTMAEQYSVITKSSSPRNNTNLPYPKDDGPTQPRQPAVAPRRKILIRRKEQDISFIPPDFHENGDEKLDIDTLSFLRERYRSRDR